MRALCPRRPTGGGRDETCSLAPYSIPYALLHAYPMPDRIDWAVYCTYVPLGASRSAAEGSRRGGGAARHACMLHAYAYVSFSSRVRRLRHGRPDSTGEQRCLSVVRHTDHPCVMCPNDTRHGLTRPPSYEMSASLLTSSLQASDNGASCAFFFCIETVVGPVHWITSDGSMAPFSEKKLFFFCTGPCVQRSVRTRHVRTVTSSRCPVMALLGPV